MNKVSDWKQDIEGACGSFRRVIPLPVPVEPERTAATYRNGVLRVELPKTEQARARRIEVRGG